MSTKKHEPMEDVLREYERDLEDMEKRCLWHPTDAYLRKLLERVRGAWKHERAEIEAQAASKMLDGATIVDLRNCGNSLAMRGALVEIRDCIKEHPCQLDEDAVFEIVTKALNEKPRNCDVGTADDGAERFMDFCRSHRSFNADCGKNCPFKDEPTAFHCFCAWEQLPYEAEKGANDGSDK